MPDPISPESLETQPVDSDPSPSPAPDVTASPDASPLPAGGQVKEVNSDAPADGAGGDEGGKVDDQVGKAKDWRDDRIRVLTAKLRAEEAKRAPTGAAVDPAPAALPEAEIDRRANARAEEIAQWQAFNNACSSAATAGRSAYPDFDSKVSELTKLTDNGRDQEAQGRYNLFLSAALETGEGPKLIYHLGQDLNEAARIMALPPVKMAIELTRLAAKEPAQASRATKPISPIGSRGAAHVSIDSTDTERADNLTTAEWMKRREAQVTQASKRN